MIANLSLDEFHHTLVSPWGKLPFEQVMGGEEDTALPTTVIGPLG